MHPRLTDLMSNKKAKGQDKIIERLVDRQTNQPTRRQNDISLDIKHDISLFIPNANTQKYGINSLNFRGSVLWNNLPIKLKECKSLQEFKLLLKQSGNLPCTCLACKA